MLGAIIGDVIGSVYEWKKFRSFYHEHSGRPGPTWKEQMKKIILRV